MKKLDGYKIQECSRVSRFLLVTALVAQLGATTSAMAGEVSSEFAGEIVFTFGVDGVSHSVAADGTETLEVVKSSRTFTLVNKSSSLSAARVVATCFKLALTASQSSSGSIFGVSTENLTTSSSNPIYYSGTSAAVTITLSADYPKSGSDMSIECSLLTLPSM